MTVLSIDFETRSTLDLKTAGVYRYAAHPSTEIICMAWAFDDDEPEIWAPPGNYMPIEVYEHLGRGEIRAWNAQFERVMWTYIMSRYTGGIPALEQWHCTAVEAAAMALPRSLDGCANALGLPHKKDEKGYRLMQRMCRPRKVTDGVPAFWNTEDKLNQLYEYCKQDVRVERDAYKKIRRLSAHEREIYLLDQRMNDRGVKIDRPLIKSCQAVAEVGIRLASEELATLTNGSVLTPTNHTNVRDYVNQSGISTESVSKRSVKELLEGDLPPAVRRVLEIRQDAGRTSVAKLESMLLCASEADDRMRGLFLYHAASTGRWAARLAQPQNFPRGEVEDVEQYIPDILAHDYEGLALFESPIKAISSLLRACLIPAEGHLFVGADYTGIEPRVLNWLAGQDDIVELFARGEDVYRHNAARLYGIRLEDVQKFPHRQAGKFQELGCGYGMGWKKGIEQAASPQFGLSLSESEAKQAVENYRATHPRVVEFWYEAERVVCESVRRPGERQRFGRGSSLTALVAGNWLYIILPSGRPLCFAAPRLVDRMTPWGAMKESLEYSGVNPITKQWGRLTTYGGAIVENIVQGVARDIMADGMLRAESEGFGVPIMTVHDEVLCEIQEREPKDFLVDNFVELLSEPPAWAKGCPIAAEGWTGRRYRK